MESEDDKCQAKKVLRKSRDGKHMAKNYPPSRGKRFQAGGEGRRNGGAIAVNEKRKREKSQFSKMTHICSTIKEKGTRK